MGNQVPANAEILAAFLYWETMWRGQQNAVDPLNDQVKFRGQRVTAIKSTSAADHTRMPRDWQCRVDGSIMRADVLRLLPLQLDEKGEPTGRRLVNDADLAANKLDPHTVTLPDSGIFNFVPQSAGASLLVIYQDPNPARTIDQHRRVRRPERSGAWRRHGGADSRLHRRRGRQCGQADVHRRQRVRKPDRPRVRRDEESR